MKISDFALIIRDEDEKWYAIPKVWNMMNLTFFITLVLRISDSAADI